MEERVARPVRQRGDRRRRRRIRAPATTASAAAPRAAASATPGVGADGVTFPLPQVTSRQPMGAGQGRLGHLHRFGGPGGGTDEDPVRHEAAYDRRGHDGHQPDAPPQGHDKAAYGRI